MDALVGLPRLEDVVLRILHLETGVTRTRLDHASQDHLLARLEDLVQIGLVEPNGGQVVAAVEQDHFEQLHPLSGRDGHALREDLARHCLEPSGPEIADRLEPAPVLIPPGKESQQIGHGLDADPAEQLGASRADPFHVLDLGLPGDAHPRRRLGRRSRGGMPRSIGLSRLGRRPPDGRRSARVLRFVDDVERRLGPLAAPLGRERIESFKQDEQSGPCRLLLRKRLPGRFEPLPDEFFHPLDDGGVPHGVLQGHAQGRDRTLGGCW